MTKFIASAPDGTLVQRNSKSRTYTHVILRRISLEYLIEQNEKWGDQYTEWGGERDLINAERCRQSAAEKKDLIAAGQTHDQWHAVSWVGRPDLVQSRINEFSSDKGASEVIAVPCFQVISYRKDGVKGWWSYMADAEGNQVADAAHAKTKKASIEAAANQELYN